MTLTPTGGIVSVEAQTMCHLCGEVIAVFFFVKVGMNADSERQYRACQACRDNILGVLDNLHAVAGRIDSQRM